MNMRNGMKVTRYSVWTPDCLLCEWSGEDHGPGDAVEHRALAWQEARAHWRQCHSKHSQKATGVTA